MLEIVDVEKGEREPAVWPVALDQAFGAMFDHPPHRQIGQLVEVGRPEQMILDGLLLADVCGARNQQVAVRDANRPMGRKKYLLAMTAGHAFFRNNGTPGAQQFNPDVATIAQFLGGKHARLTGSHSQLRRRGVVDQQEAALLVLNRDAGREHSEDIPQNAQFAFSGEFAFALGCGGLQVKGGAALHDRRGCQSLL